jgi:hypothetical protein
MKLLALVTPCDAPLINLTRTWLVNSSVNMACRGSVILAVVGCSWHKAICSREGTGCVSLLGFVHNVYMHGALGEGVHQASGNSTDA